MRRVAVFALAGLLLFAAYGSLIPGSVRCPLPGAVGCPGGLLGPAVVPASSGDQWFDVTMYDWGFWIVDSTSGVNETNDWTVFEGWTVHINATSLPPDTAIGGTAYHGFGVEINATGQQLLSLAAPVGKWVTATFVAPATPYYHQHIWCTIQCGPGHGSQQAHVLNVVPAVNYPDASAIANATVGPAPFSVGFSGNATVGAPPYNLSWSFGDGSPVAYGTPVAHTYTLGGIYYATLTVTDSKGNPGRATVTITVLSSAPLRANLTATPPDGPVPLGTAFSAVAHGGTPPYQYLWSYADGSNASGPNATTHIYTAPGQYAASVTVVDSVGASVRAVALVVVRPSAGTFNLTATASPSNSTAPFSPTLNASASGGRAPYTFRWDFGDGAVGVGASVAPLYNLSGSYEAAVFASDAAGRTAVAFVQVVATPANSSGGDDAPSGGPAVGSPLVQGLALGIVLTPSGGGAPLTVHAAVSIEGGSGQSEAVKWNFGDGTSATGQVTSHLFANVGTYNVTVSATDSQGNTGATSAIVRVGTLAMQIVVNASGGDAPFALTAAATITGGSGIYGNESWSWGDGTGAVGGIASHSYGPNAMGVLTLSSQSTDSSGTRVSATTTVSIDPPPTATISVTRSGPGGIPLPVILTVSVVNGSGQFAPLVLWSFGDLSGGRGPTTVNHTYNRTGDFYVTVETNDSYGRPVVAHAWVNVSLTMTLPPGSSGTWIFTGVPDPQDAAFALIGLVALTGLFFLRRKRSLQGTKGPSARPTSGGTAPAKSSPPPRGPS